MNMMPSDCHIGCTQSASVSDHEAVSSDLSVVAEPDHEADQPHATAQGLGSSDDVGKKSRRVKLCFEGAEESWVSSSLLLPEKPGQRLRECGQNGSVINADGVCTCPACQESNDVSISIEELDNFVEGFEQSCSVRKTDSLEGAAASDTPCYYSSGSKLSSSQSACARASPLHMEQHQVMVEQGQPVGTSAHSDKCCAGALTEVSEEISLSDRVLKEEGDESRHDASGNGWDTHVSDNSAALNLKFDSVNGEPQHRRLTCSPGKRNSNSNADTENVSSDHGHNVQPSSAVSSGNPSEEQTQSSIGHGEQAGSRARFDDLHGQAQNGFVASEGQSSEDANSPTTSELSSVQSAFFLEPASSIECVDSAPLMDAISLVENHSELSDMFCLNRDTDSLPLIIAVQAEQREASICTEPSHENNTSQLMSVDISEIPDEILLKVFSYFKPAELCRHVNAVCKHWYRLAYDHSLWRKLDVSSIRMNGFQLCQVVLRTSGAIRYLDMSDMKNLSNAEMAVVAENCPDLTHLDVGFVDDLTSTMMHSILTSCPHLQFLNVEGCRNANNDMMRELAASAGPALKRLNFSHCSLVDESLWLMMGHIHGITHLNIDGISWISELVVQHLASEYRDTLESLELDGNEVTDSTVQFVSGCHHLKVLSISFCEQLTDQCVRHLKRLENLDRLILRKGPSFSASALTTFLSSPTLQNLTYLDLSECQQLNDEGVQAMAQTCGQKLKTLCLSWCWEVSDRGMDSVATRCSQMVKMFLVGLHRLEAQWLPTALQTMTNLVYISFEQCNEVEDIVIEEAVRDKPDLVIINYYGELFMHKTLPQ